MVNVISTVTEKRHHDPASTPLSLGALIPVAEPKAFTDAESNLRDYLAALQKKDSSIGRNHGGPAAGVDTNPAAGATNEDDFEF